MTTISRRWSRFERSSDAYLAVTAALMLLIIVPIILKDTGGVERAFTVLLVGVATTIAMAASRAHRWAIRLSWVAPIVILAGAVLPWDSSTLTLIMGSALVLMLISTPVVILRRIGSHERITATTMWGAIAAYLALGMAFSLVYTLLFHLNAEAFTNVTDESLGNFNYFSFVTMTTLGYGDITPVDDVPRAMVILQTLIGQIYLVVVVARVVSLLGRDVPAGGPQVENLEHHSSPPEDGNAPDGHGSADQRGK